MRTLVVIRHARAESSAVSDLARRLTADGRADAAQLGRWLVERDITPELALVSAATRTAQTWTAVAAGAGWQVAPTLDDALYETMMSTVIDLVHQVEESVRTVVVVGHNPTMAALALMLDDGDGDQAVLTEMALGFPTSAAAVYEYDGAWADLRPAAARVVAFHVGRG